MSKDDDITSDSMKVITMLKLENGDVIEAEALTPEQREAYIEFAIHLAAPRIAKLLVEGLPAPKEVVDRAESSAINEGYFKYPSMMTVKQAAEFLNVGESMVREMERRWQGKFFPAVRMGSTIRIPRDELIEWVKNGGINNYKKQISEADAEHKEQQIRSQTRRSNGRKK